MTVRHYIYGKTENAEEAYEAQVKRRTLYDQRQPNANEKNWLGSHS